MKVSFAVLFALPATIACQQPPTELRSYTLATFNATNQYVQTWRKHIESLKQFNITTRAVWTPEGNDKQVMALVQYAIGDDPAVVGAAYMASEAFTNDMAGFNLSDIESVISTILNPTSFSPIL
ncbi:NIPSNAP domain-containing protein [Fusarium sp. LHS14.1]|nr:NIPSNAP domain-containing protein [Fusarium sp. LHS14.1]